MAITSHDPRTLSHGSQHEHIATNIHVTGGTDRGGAVDIVLGVVDPHTTSFPSFVNAH